MNIKQIFIILAACILVLGGCISPWKGEEGTLSVSIGSGTGRAAFNLDEKSINQLVHTIALSNGPGPQQTKSNLKYGDTVNFSVTPGNWTITITAFLDEQVYAAGSWKGYIKPGPNGAIQITMKIAGEDASGGGEPDENLKPAIMVTDSDDDVNEGTLRWAIAQADESPGPDTIIIDVNSSIILNESLSITSDITIIAQQSVTIPRYLNSSTTASAESFFIVEDGGTLTLGGNDVPITLDGGNLENCAANAALITVNSGGILVMNNLVTLQNNENKNNINNGGGVYVGSGGTFTMNGGTISDNGTEYGNGGGIYVDDGTFTMNGGKISYNTANGGGGVYVGISNDGTFTMNGGTISNNTANEGGGVYVQGGTFQISGGIVYGSNGSANDANTTSGGDGAALYVWGGTAQHGKDSSWKNILSTTGPNYRNTTIEVIDGVLTP